MNAKLIGRDLAGTPHIILRRVMSRMIFLCFDLPPGTEPDLSWPQVVALIMSNTARDMTDSFSGKRMVLKRHQVIERDDRGRTMEDEDGKVRYVWVEGEEEMGETLSDYGTLVRMVAGANGLEAKALSRWTSEEVLTIAAACSSKIERSTGPRALARAEEFPDWPTGWREAFDASVAYGKERAKMKTAKTTQEQNGGAS